VKFLINLDLKCVESLKILEKSPLFCREIELCIPPLLHRCLFQHGGRFYHEGVFRRGVILSWRSDSIMDFDILLMDEEMCAYVFFIYLVDF